LELRYLVFKRLLLCFYNSET